MSLLADAIPTDGRLVIEMQPQGAALAMLGSRRPEVLIQGAAGTGKTMWLTYKAAAICCKYPGARVLLARKTRTSLTQSALVTLENKVLCGNVPGNAGRDNRSSYLFEHDNGQTSELVVGGLDKPERIMSTEYDWIGIPEATELDLTDYEQLLTRLRNGRVPYQQIVADCNPAFQSHWLNQRFPAIGADDARRARFHSLHSDNPSVTAEYLAVLNTLTGHRRARLLEGRWCGDADLAVFDEDGMSYLQQSCKMAGSCVWFGVAA